MMFLYRVFSFQFTLKWFGAQWSHTGWASIHIRLYKYLCEQLKKGHEHVILAKRYAIWFILDTW